MMKKTILFALMLSMTASVFAIEVEIGGLWYEVLSKTKEAKVIQYKNNKYGGEIVIPETVEHDGITYSVTSIKEAAFYQCYGLTSVTIPNSVTSIQDGSYYNGAFYECNNLKHVTFSNNLENIGKWSFMGCSSLTSINIPNSVTYLGTQSFRNCSGLKTIIIPNSVTSIEGWAFEGCSNLTSITLPNSLTYIEAGLFQDCSNLLEVSIPNLVKSINDYAFLGCSRLTSLIIPNSVTSIGGYAFKGCSSLTSFTIPDNVESIGIYAFQDCASLATIAIGKNIKIVNEKAFEKCPELIEVYCYAESVPTTNTDAFQNSYIEYATLHVPESSLEAYKTTAPWSDFGEIVPLSPYTLTYYVDGEVYKTYLHEAGIAIPAEPAPEKEGYTFSGWSEIPETMPDHDVEVTGTFTVNKYNLIYMVDGEEYKTVEIKYGAEITPEDGPEKEGYTFMGWSEIPETMPANDVTVTGIYEKNLLGKCATPIIAYANDELTFSSETEDVEFVYDIKVNGSTSGTGNKVKVATTLTVNVYAKKDGYENSDVATKEIQPKFGDLSGDGEVNAVDLTKLIEILLKR